MAAIFQSYTLPTTSNPPLLVDNLINLQSYTLPTIILQTSNPLANFQFLHFWLRNLETSNSSTFGTKTWNFQSSRKLPILPLMVRKISNSSTFGYENLKNLQSYTLPTTSNPPLLVTKTWKTSNPTHFLGTIMLETSNPLNFQSYSTF